MTTTDLTKAGAALRAWREGAGKEQAALARELGVAPPSLCDWEYGRRRPSSDNALVLDAMSGGAVPVSLWGYPQAVLDAVSAIAARNAGDVAAEG